MLPTKRILAAVAAGGVALLGLTGCRTDPGSAAVVGGQTITDAQLTSIVRNAMSDPTVAQQVSNPAEFARRELTTRIELLLFRAAAASAGVTVTQAQVDSELQQIVQQAGSRQALDAQAAQQGTPPSDIPVNIELNLLVTGLAHKAGISDPTSQTAAQQVNQVALQALTTQSRRLGVRVNPRYGSWNPSHVTIEPVTSGLSRPATT